MERPDPAAKPATWMTSLDVNRIVALVKEAGDWLLSTFPDVEPPVDREGMFTTFRAVNGRTEEHLKTGLSALYPGIAWLGEDFELGGDTPAPAGEAWVCDAIDGAVQYLHHLPYWAISLSLLRDGAPVFSLVYDAVHGEVFHAIAGGGAYLDHVPIRAGKKQVLEDAFAVCSQPPFVGNDPVATRRAGASVSAALTRVAALRNLGAASLQLAYVAAGRLDIYWEYGDDLANWLGASLLLREAGAAVSDAEGRPFGWESRSFVATAPALHAAFLEVLAAVE